MNHQPDNQQDDKVVMGMDYSHSKDETVLVAVNERQAAEMRKLYPGYKVLISERLPTNPPKQHSTVEETEKVDRLEVIDETGRAYVKGSIYGTPVKVELSYQDDGRTLKVFVTELKKSQEGGEE